MKLNPNKINMRLDNTEKKKITEPEGIVIENIQKEIQREKTENKKDLWKILRRISFSQGLV